MKLTDEIINNATPKEKMFKLYDGKGLHLQVMPNGNKRWRIRYRFLGVEKQLSMGIYPEVIISEAREKTLEMRRLLREGIDPSADRKYKNINRSFCAWTFLSQEGGDNFNTKCGSSFSFAVGGITENEFKFCPYCGKTIHEVW